MLIVRKKKSQKHQLPLEETRKRKKLNPKYAEESKQ
jgi:hypothetical protein